MAGRDRFLDVVGGYRSFTFPGDSVASQVFVVYQNVRITVYKLQADGTREGTVATIYSTRSGAAKSNPFTTAAGGSIDFFADPAEYQIDVLDLNNPVRFATYTINWSSVPGGVDGMSASQLPGSGGGLAQPGDIKMAGLISVAQADPSGWLWCDGRIVSRTTYAALFAAIGTVFNTGGETASQFRLPDLRGRVPMGPNSFATAAGSSGRISNGSANIGNTAGTENVTLTIAQIPPHEHLLNVYHLNDPSSGGAPASVGAQWSVSLTLSGAWRYLNSGYTAVDGGSGGSHNNLQPYQCVGFLIKV
jgi:microcystin-dependent protein